MRSKGHRRQACQNYITGMTHKMNAAQQGVSVNTVKSWCVHYKWLQRFTSSHNGTECKTLQRFVVLRITTAFKKVATFPAKNEPEKITRMQY